MEDRPVSISCAGGQPKFNGAEEAENGGKRELVRPLLDGTFKGGK